eukprot:gene3789-4741_t
MKFDKIEKAAVTTRSMAGTLTPMGRTAGDSVWGLLLPPSVGFDPCYGEEGLATQVLQMQPREEESRLSRIRGLPPSAVRQLLCSHLVDESHDTLCALALSTVFQEAADAGAEAFANVPHYACDGGVLHELQAVEDTIDALGERGWLQQTVCRSRPFFSALRAQPASFAAVSIDIDSGDMGVAGDTPQLRSHAPPQIIPWTPPPACIEWHECIPPGLDTVGFNYSYYDLRPDVPPSAGTSLSGCAVVYDDPPHDMGEAPNYGS